MERIRPPLASIEAKLADHELAVKKMEELTAGGTYPVEAALGAEGYGKTARGHLFALARFEGVGWDLMRWYANAGDGK